MPKMATLGIIAGRSMPEALQTLRRVAASDVKKRGWRGIVREVLEHGSVIVTNHAAPEAVVISVKNYTALLDAAQQHEARAASELDALRQSFDARLAALDEPTASVKLRSIMRRPAKLGGKVKTGSGY